eukprot:11754691-Karenia_brevis.AAC.1
MKTKPGIFQVDGSFFQEVRVIGGDASPSSVDLCVPFAILPDGALVKSWINNEEVIQTMGAFGNTYKRQKMFQDGKIYAAMHLLKNAKGDI